MVHNHLSATSPSPSSSPTTTTLAPPTSSSTSSSSPATSASSRYRRSSRKARHHHGINIPADTVLNFSTYHPPSSSPNLNNNNNNTHHSSSSYTYSTSSAYYNNYQHKVQTSLRFRPREQFVQANFRFLVAQTSDDTFADLRTCQLCPEALVPWSCVDRVILPRPSDCCAICLSPLQCPRVTPCGHVFDHVCLLQLFAHAVPHKVVRCPLCFNSFSEPSLRPCAFATAVSPSVGENMSMRLVTRNRGSMICHAHPSPPLPSIVNDNSHSNNNNNNHHHHHNRCHHQHSVADVNGDELENIPVIEAVDNPLFSRFAFTDPNFLLQLIQRDEQDLYQVLSEDPSLAPFVDTAMADLELRRLDIRSRPPLRRRRGPVDDNSSTHTSSNSTNTKTPLPDSESTEPPQPTTHTSRAPTHREKTSGLPPPAPSSSSSSSSHRTHHHHHKHNAASSQRHGKGPWYFYQDSGSGNTFLHPVNHRCLSTELRNDFDRDAANTIHGDIVEVERYTMDEALRKRYRFLEHLPDGCEFAFVELDLSHMLSGDTMTVHAQDLKDRENARRKRKIAYARETERVEREQTNSLREYYTSLGRRPHGVCGFEQHNNSNNHDFNMLINNLSQQLTVDRTDETNFPKLSDGDDPLLSSSSAHGSMAAPTTTTTTNSAERGGGGGGGGGAGATTATITITSAGYPIVGANAGGACASSPGASGWGPGVSSYSSVTSNMGLFPALGSSPQADVPNPSSAMSRRGAWGSSSGGNSGPSASLTPPLGSSPQTPRGVWANNNNNNNVHSIHHGGGGGAGSTVTAQAGHRGGVTGGAWSSANASAAAGLMMSVSPGNNNSSSSSGPQQQTQGSSNVVIGPGINRTGSTTTTTSNSQQASEPRRNGRRSHGKPMLLLSNAGAQARR